MSYLQLPLLFGGYIHPDWRLEVSSSQEAVQNFVQRESPEIVAVAKVELWRLLQSTLQNSDLRHLVVDEWGCYFDPAQDGLLMRTWLADIEKAVG